MITLKEFEVYLKVKEFIESNNLEESDVIPQINSEGVVANYVPLIVESSDMEPKKFYLLSAAARGNGIPKQTIDYAYKNRKSRITRRKGGVKVFSIEWL